MLERVPWFGSGPKIPKYVFMVWRYRRVRNCTYVECACIRVWRNTSQVFLKNVNIPHIYEVAKEHQYSISSSHIKWSCQMPVRSTQHRCIGLSSIEWTYLSDEIFVRLLQYYLSIRWLISMDISLFFRWLCDYYWQKSSERDWQRTSYPMSASDALRPNVTNWRSRVNGLDWTKTVPYLLYISLYLVSLVCFPLGCRQKSCPKQTIKIYI